MRLFEEAQKCHQAGRLQEAVNLYLLFLDQPPQHPEAHGLLGVVYSQLGDHDPAVAHLQQAVALQPHNPMYQHNLGEALRRSGRAAAAVLAYEQALTLNPEFAEAHCNLGHVYREQGRLGEAISCYQQAVMLRPGYFQAQYNLANVLLLVGRPQEAAQSYQKALQWQPNHAQAHYNLGLAWQQSDQTAAAVSHWQQALALQPDFVLAHAVLAAHYRDNGLPGRAIHHFQQAARLQPNNGDYHFQLGYLFSMQGQLEGAKFHYERAAELQPHSAETRNNLAVVIQNLGRLKEAIRHFQEAMALNPSLPNIPRNLGLAYKLTGQIAETRQSYQRSLALADDDLLRLEMETIPPYIVGNQAQIDHYRAELSQTLASHAARPGHIDLTQLHLGEACPPYTLVYQAQNDRPIKEAWAKLFSGRLPLFEPRPNSGQPHLGFVVTHTHEGVFQRSMGNILNQLAATNRFRLTVVSNRPDAIHYLKQHLPSPAIHFLLLPAQLDQAALALHRATFDLLYYWEVGTDAANYFLPFFRPAAHQCTSWGWQVTTGIPQMDSYLSSHLLEPADGQSHYSEKLVLLDTLLTCYTRPDVPTSPPSPANFGFNSRQHLYFCAQNLLKIHPDFDSLAAEILRRDPLGLLILVGLENEFPAGLLRQRFQQTMPDVLERVHLLPRLREPEFWGLLALADVVLDTPHYGGVNTTYQALAAGTPIVTRPGPFQRGRYTFGAYQKMGFFDCVAHSPEDYVNKALQLGNDKGYRAKISQQIRQASPVLFGDPRPAQELADYFEQVILEMRGAGMSRPEPTSPHLLFLDASTSDYGLDTPYHKPLGGSQSAVCYLAGQLAGQGYRVTLLSRNSRPGVSGRGASLVLPANSNEWLDLLRGLAADVIVVLNAALPPVLAPLRPHTKLVLWTQHAADQPGVSDLAKAAYRDYWDAFVFVSQWQRGQYQQKFGLAPENCFVLPNAISPFFAVGGDPAGKKPFSLAYTSTPYRGLDLLLKMWPEIKAAVPQAELQIFSSQKVYQNQEPDSHQALYEQAGQMDGVIYRGAVPQAELAAALGQTAVLAYPNTFPETACIAVMEAMAAGCRVVTSDLGALPETTAGFARLISWENGEEAYCAQFVQAIIAALHDTSDLTPQIAFARSHYNWSRQAQLWRDLLG